MSSHGNATFPFRELREQITELEAAMLDVLHKPNKKAVHRIRTATRRIEAQLELLDTLALKNANLQSLDGRLKAEQKTRKALAHLRKAAGKVRDLDVQRKLVKEAAGATGKKEVQADAADLRDWLKHQRAQEADRFHGNLDAHREKLAPRLQAVLDVLTPAEGLRLTESQLVRATESWFERCAADAQPGTSADDRLHAIRKSAKLARYIAESGGQSMHRAQAVAKKFEDLQDCGGQWHDLLTLSKLARKHLSRKSALVQRLSLQESRMREEFCGRIDAGREPGSVSRLKLS